MKLLLLLLCININININNQNIYLCDNIGIISKKHDRIIITELFCQSYTKDYKCTDLNYTTLGEYSSILCNKINDYTCQEYNLAVSINNHNVTVFAPYCKSYSDMNNNNISCVKTEIIYKYNLSTLMCVAIK